MNICHSISALSNTNFYKTTKTIESFNKPIGNKAFSTNSLDRAATIKVRAKSMFKKKESEVGCLERAIVDDYQHYIEAIKIKPMTSMNSERKHICKRRPFPVQGCLSCFGVLTAEDIYDTKKGRNLANAQNNLRASTRMNPSFKRIKTPLSTKNIINDVRLYEFPKEDRGVIINSAVSAQRFYGGTKKAHQRNKTPKATDVARVLFESTLNNILKKGKSPVRSINTLENPYRRIFGYTSKKYSYFHIE